MGLHDSTVRFFWVAWDKATTTSLQQISGDKGLVVPWSFATPRWLPGPLWVELDAGGCLCWSAFA
jgi:hypothetical protein